MIRQEIKNHCHRYAFRVGDIITITLDTRAATEVTGTIPTFGTGRVQFAVNGVTIKEYIVPLTKAKKKKKRKKKSKKNVVKKSKKSTATVATENPIFHKFHIVSAIRDAHTFVSIMGTLI